MGERFSQASDLFRRFTQDERGCGFTPEFTRNQTRREGGNPSFTGAVYDVTVVEKGIPKDCGSAECPTSAQNPENNGKSTLKPYEVIFAEYSYIDEPYTDY